MKLKSLLVLFAFVGSSLSAAVALPDESASPQYNPFENQWEMAAPDARPQYNPFENKWEMAEPDAQPQYNPFENRWEMGTDD